jgi:hypothetical protein
MEIVASGDEGYLPPLICSVGRRPASRSPSLRQPLAVRKRQRSTNSLPVQVAGQRLQANAFSTGEHDRPEIASRIEHGWSSRARPRPAAASRLMGSVR